MERNELKRANDLKEFEIKLEIYKRIFELGIMREDEYIKALKYTMDAINEGRD